MTDYVQILEPDGSATGATFDVERVEGATTIRYDSRGTTAGTRAYRRGMVLLLTRLSDAGVTIQDACIETRTTQHLSRAQRRLPIKAPFSFPMRVEVDDEEGADALRAAIHTAAARAGRAKDAKGGGNGTKRLRIYLKTRVSAAELRRRISAG